MKDLRRFLLSTTLIAVLCTIICPSARGGSILFTTSVTGEDSWHPKKTDGPVAGAADLSLDHSGYGYISAWNLWGPYTAVSDTLSTFAGKLLPNGEIQVGSLITEGEVDGYDTGKVKGTVTFSMTIGETQPFPPSAPPAASIPFFFYPTLNAGCHTETSGTATSTCEAEAAVSITDNTTGSTQSATLPVSGPGQTIYPPFEIDAYEGDTITINLIAGLELGGVVFGCGPAGETPVVICGPELGAYGHAAVDPLFEFDQKDFTGGYNLSDYYQFEFSPNIPGVPHMATPEPSSLLLFGTFLAGVCLAALRRSM
jgi:hypothetical protein